MTKDQRTISISVAISTLLLAIVALFVWKSSKTFTKQYVKDQIEFYDSLKVTPRMKELDRNLDSLNAKADKQLDISNKILNEIIKFPYKG